MPTVVATVRSKSTHLQVEREDQPVYVRLLIDKLTSYRSQIRKTQLDLYPSASVNEYG